jgi:hypothetical protein
VALIEGKAWATAALGRKMTKKESKEFVAELETCKEEDFAVIQELEDAETELLIMDGKGEYSFSIHDRARRRWMKRKQKEQARAEKRVRFESSTQQQKTNGSQNGQPATAKKETTSAVPSSVDEAPKTRAPNAISGATGSSRKTTKSPEEAERRGASSRSCSRSNQDHAKKAPVMGASDSAEDKYSGSKATISKFMVEDLDNVTVTTAEETDTDWETDEEGGLDGNDSETMESEDWDAHPPQHWNIEDPRVTAGLGPPRLLSGSRVDGSNKRQLRRENKARRIRQQELQREAIFWSDYQGGFEAPEKRTAVSEWKNNMCPKNLALEHPAAEKLLQYATGGCPCNTGKPWSKEMIHAAVERGPHVSALDPEAIEQLRTEIAEKEKIGQCKVVLWDDIKNDPPKQLKVSPLAMIPHKSRKFRAILDLSFKLRLKDGSVVPSVNEATTLEAPAAAIDQMGHALSRIIHAFAEADEDAKIFMAKFDIKDGFWRLDCEEGEEWNFAYVLPQHDGEPTRLVIPTSLQMGWVESPPYFCAASETARDVAVQYMETEVGALDEHKFLHHAMGSDEVKRLPRQSTDKHFKYLVEVYVDDFIPMAIATSQEQLEHVANAVMHGIHDVFPADELDSEDPISLKKLLKQDGQWALLKDCLGFTFDGDAKTMLLEEPKREFLLATLTKWIRTANHKSGKVPFTEFESIIAKVRHAFMCIPAGRGLLTPMNRLLRARPDMVNLHRNKKLLTAVKDCRTLLREATKDPTRCKELVMGEPDFIGVKDASLYGVGGVIIGENKECVPTVFRMEWPQWVKEEVWKTNSGEGGRLTNSDLEMAGLLLLFLVMEDVCKLQPGAHVALFSDNSPTVSWVRKMAAKGSKVADQLLRALALRLKQRHVSPLTPLHVAGKKNAMTDIPSRSFGSEAKWHCKTDNELLTLFNNSFPLPNQSSWTVYRPSSAITSRIMSVLANEVLEMDEWRRLPRPGRHTGEIGSGIANLWEWTLSFREECPTMSSPGQSSASWEWSERENSDMDARSELQRFQQRSLPLTRRSLWPQDNSL